MSKKSDALIALMIEARSERRFTQTAINRVAKACSVLELNRAEIIAVFGYLDACDSRGNPWAGSNGRYSIKLPAK